MISRFPGLTPSRSRAVVHDGLVFTVAVAPDPITPSMYEQSAKGRANPPMRACIGVELEPPHIVEIVVTAAK